MNIKKTIILFMLAFVTVIGITSTQHTKQVEAFSSQIIQHGAVGEDVIELQARLQYLGFYNGKIDGVFGWGTYWALRNFQYEFGLDIDGLAGSSTKQKLEKASQYDKQFVREQINAGNDFTYYGGTPKENQVKQPQNQNQTNQANQGTNANNQNQGTNANNQEQADQPTQPTAVNVPNGFSQNDIQLMANAVYGEARGEPYEGQVAVAAVILNRVESPTFPNTVSGVIFEPRAFTAVADGQIWLTPNDRARKAVLDAINGWDPTGEAIYYFNPDTATSSWIWGRPQIKRIGKHVFCM
ncbi:spore cortex-lytic enzyme [Aquibacillus koreensis]|uniref:Spore cortex-lytic enzyme n=1 Tax=Aquibacillus koreensis TaxID=279446 RepID=A0A9X3WI70_9BACI|nr:spore cortex-lytic enzyme [Aquibacillus koreensis]MCT2537405.1 spore cortex-lytic enzyme [Aquibacillus koreensis]MDC3418851.1 spore cortex-lytic enzyme [Aquibacillus koreensis]